MDKKSILIGGSISTILIILSFFYGSYLSASDIIIEKNNERFTPVIMEYHVEVYLQKQNSEKVFYERHAGTITLIGRSLIKNLIANSTFSKETANYISLSSNSSTPSTYWGEIPNEISTGGLTRALATYTSLGYGTFRISHEFTASTSINDIQLVGLNWESSGNNNLLCSDKFTPVDLESGDKITINWELIIS